MKNKKRLIIIIAAAFIIFAVLSGIFVYISTRVYDGAHFGIEDYKSRKDADGDGIDDQTDILLSVKAYLDTKPRYKSVYYAETGYPNDNYGVCTDVVAFGLLGAGYDLSALVNADRAANPDDYRRDEKPDPKIDFRRVRNLIPYFKNNAIELTTDISKIEEWMPGDIVVFEGHIGVISEHRDYLGVPLVYHHGSAGQTEYEQDILRSAEGKIVGHFRVS